MVEILHGILPYLGVGIGLLIFFVLVRELIRLLGRGRWQRKRKKCLALIGQINRFSPEELLPLALELKKSFPIELIEDVLREYQQQVTDHKKLTEVYGRLGVIDKYLQAFKEAKSWSERANAAQRLGEIGHASAVLPLIATLEDPHEEREVKSVAMRALGQIQDERAIAPLIEGLGLPDRGVGQLLSDVLTQFGEKAIYPLIKTLSFSKQESQRFWGVQILGRIKNRKALTPLMTSLSDPIAKVRAAAARALGNMGAREASSTLCRLLLEDPDPLTREAAAEALGMIADDKSMIALKEGLADLDHETRHQAMEALERMGEKGVPFFLEALQEGGEQAKVQAASALERIGVVATKIEQLDGKEGKEIFEFLRLVAKTGVVETLIRSLTHERLKVRIFLCRILGEAIQSRTLEALTDLAQRDSEWAGRLEALLALVKLANPHSLPVLSRALSEEEEMVRESLLNALKKAPRLFLHEIWRAISLLLQDANLTIRTKAVEVLSKLSLPEIVPLLLNSLTDSFWEVRKQAALALGSFELQKEEIVPLLIQALEDPSHEVRLAAVKSLGSLKDPRAIEGLTHCFEWADESSRNTIATSLAAMPVDNLLNFTDQLMILTHPKARAGVVWTLGLMGDEKIIPLIVTFLSDPDPMVRKAAAGALGRQQRKPTPELLLHLGDPNQRVRATVVKALWSSEDSSLIEKLVVMLENEPDLFVCQRVVLAIGCLAETTDGRLQLTDYKHSIQNWLKKASDEKSQAAGFVALALLGDETSFQKILLAIFKPSLVSLMKEFLREIPQGIRGRFFSFLSLDPQLFWHDQIERVGESYRDILRSGHEVQKRIRAIEALVLLGEKSSLPLIESAFAKDPSPAVRGAALKALGRWLNSRELLTKISEAIGDSSSEVCSHLLPMIERLSPKELEGARERLIPLLEARQEEIRKPISKLLARLYYHDWHLLADQLIGTDKKLSIIGLIETLGEIGDAKASPFFLQFLKHHDPQIRGASAEAAAKGGLLSRRDWNDALEDPQESVRFFAIRGLGRELDSKVVDIFASHLTDPSSQIRREIASLLGKRKIVGDGRPASLLKHLSQDAHAGVRVTSLISLFRLGEKGIAKDMASLIPNIEASEFKNLLAHLEKEGFFIELVATLEHGRDMGSRKEALEVLATLDLSHYSREIARSLQDPASEVRLAAIQALGQLEDPSIQVALEALSQDPVEEVRLAVKKRKLKMVK